MTLEILDVIAILIVAKFVVTNPNVMIVLLSIV